MGEDGTRGLGNEGSAPLVSVVVVHFSNVEYLRNCVASVSRSRYRNLELIIVDNGYPKLSPPDIPRVDIESTYVASTRNMGYGDGCNQGIEAARGQFVFLLNNDVEIEPDCISELVECASRDQSIAVVQPKMLDLKDRGLFHSSGAGGMIDIFGYPFARGRIFDRVERDNGQYDTVCDIFWASGAALFVRKEVLRQSGYFDTSFFMYMEEIDLMWRMHLLGSYRVVFVPTARIYHLGSPNIGRDDVLRMYYVHRNSLVMMCKNYSPGMLMLTLPVRCVLELGAAMGHLFMLKWKRTLAVFMALGYVCSHLPAIRKRRAEVQAKRRVTDRYIVARMCKMPIVVTYLWGRERRSEVTDRQSTAARPDQAPHEP